MEALYGGLWYRYTSLIPFFVHMVQDWDGTSTVNAVTIAHEKAVEFAGGSG